MVRDKTGASVAKAFETVMINSKITPEKLWVDESREFFTIVSFRSTWRKMEF